MRLKYILIISSFFTLFIGCDEDKFASPYGIRSYFDHPFQNRAKNLTWVLGDEFSLKREKDTLNYTVSFNKESRVNMIINKVNNDTIFEGKVCKYKQLYYFNQQISDTSYWIYAVKIENNLIRGLATGWSQMFHWDQHFDTIFTRHLKNDSLNNSNKPWPNVQPEYLDSVLKRIKITPKKKVLRPFYESIVKKLPVDTIIDFKLSEEEESNEVDTIFSTSDTQDYNLERIDLTNKKIINQIYPNPAVNLVNISLHSEELYNYEFIDLKGKIVMNGKLSNKENKISLTERSNGIYFIRIFSEDGQEIETVKLLVKK